MKRFLLLAVVLLLSACGQGLTGTYADINQNWSMSLTFDGGKVTQKMWGGGEDSSNAQEITFPYELDGNKIKVQGPQGAGILLGTLQEDGSIKGSMALMGGKFVKQE